MKIRLNTRISKNVQNSQNFDLNSKNSQFISFELIPLQTDRFEFNI